MRKEWGGRHTSMFSIVLQIKPPSIEISRVVILILVFPHQPEQLAAHAGTGQGRSARQMPPGAREGGNGLTGTADATLVDYGWVILSIDRRRVLGSRACQPRGELRGTHRRPEPARTNRAPPLSPGAVSPVECSAA